MVTFETAAQALTLARRVGSRCRIKLTKTFLSTGVSFVTSSARARGRDTGRHGSPKQRDENEEVHSRRPSSASALRSLSYTGSGCKDK